jgi:predicted small lipoprotein YifL
MRRLAALLVLASLLCACGSRGSLYLPPAATDDTAVEKPKKK